MVFCSIWILWIWTNFIGIWLMTYYIRSWFVFPDQEPPVTSSLYERSGNYVEFRLCSFICSLVISSKLIIFYIVLWHCYINCFFLHNRSLLVPYTYVAIESIDFILLSSLTYNAILFFSKRTIFVAFKYLL